MKANRSLFAALIALSLTATAAVATRDVDRTVPADANVRIEIENMAGSLTITAWDRNEIRITGTLGDDIEALAIEGSGASVTIDVEVPERRARGSWGRNDMAADLEISVPAGASVEAESISASITTDGVRGPLDLESVSGNLEVSGAASGADLETVSGSIQVRGSLIPVTAESVSGSIELDGVGSRIEASSVSGRVHVRAARLERGEMEAVSGSIEFEGSLDRGGRLEASSHSGNVAVTLPSDTSARFDISSYSGGIDNEMGPQAERESRWVPAKSAKFTTGDGDGEVTIETFSGNVRLRRR